MPLWRFKRALPIARVCFQVISEPKYVLKGETLGTGALDGGSNRSWQVARYNGGGKDIPVTKVSDVLWCTPLLPNSSVTLLVSDAPLNYPGFFELYNTFASVIPIKGS